MPEPPSASSQKLNAGLLQRYFLPVYETVAPLLYESSKLRIDEDESPALLGSPASKIPRLNIIIGTCPALMQRLLEEHKETLYRIFWVEPDPLQIASSLSLHALTTVISDQRTRIITNDDLKTLETLLREDVTGIGIWGLHVWAAKKYADSDTLKKVMQTVRSVEAIAVENASVQYHQGPEVQRNIISNLPYILHATVLDQWKDRCQNQPAIVVGAGPSLDQNIDTLASGQNKAWIVSVDTALKPLLAKGIEPDIVVSCDPTTLNTRHFESISLPAKTVFAFLPEIHRSVLPQLQHQHTLCLHDSNSKLLEALTIPLQIKAAFSRGMNVGFCAYSLARMLGCSPIILTGMNLSFEGGKSSHAKGTANASTVKIDHENETIHLTGNVHTNKSTLIEIDGYHGKPVKTFSHFYLVLQRFVQDIAHHQVQVINATEGGANIAGTTQMSLQNALQECTALSKNDKELPRYILNSEMLQHTSHSIQGYLRELGQTKEFLERGMYRVQQWRQEVESSHADIDGVKAQTKALLQHWQSVMDSKVLDVCLDIGLAPMRFDTYRVEAPDTEEPMVLAQWWHDWLLAHFETMRDDVEIYRQMYTNALNTLILS